MLRTKPTSIIITFYIGSYNSFNEIFLPYVGGEGKNVVNQKRPLQARDVPGYDIGIIGDLYSTLG